MSAPQENKHHQWCQGGLQLQGDLQDSADKHQKMVPIYLKKTLQIFRLTVGKQQYRYPKTSPWLLRYVPQTHPRKTVPLHLVVIFTTLQAQSPEDSAAHQTCLRNILHCYPQFLPPGSLCKPVCSRGAPGLLLQPSHQETVLGTPTLPGWWNTGTSKPS